MIPKDPLPPPSVRFTAASNSRLSTVAAQVRNTPLSTVTNATRPGLDVAQPAMSDTPQTEWLTAREHRREDESQEQKARELVRGGAGCRSAFQQLGIALGPRAENLEHQLLRELGLPMVRAGTRVDDVCQLLEIQQSRVFLQFHLDVLREIAMPQVRSGAAFNHVRDALGVPAGKAATKVSRELLDELGTQRVRDGEGWDAVARDLGIDPWIRPIDASSQQWPAWIPRAVPLNPTFIGNVRHDPHLAA